MSIRFQIAALTYMIVGPALSGLGIVAVLASRHAAGHWAQMLPVAVIAGLALAAPLAWLFADRLVARTRGTPTDPEA